MSGSLKRILVADDVRDSADTLAALLGGNGFDARAVYDGRDAVTVANLWHPDGALLDLSLPGLSGFEVAREFRRSYGTNIRLVAYTGWGSASDRQRCLDAGFDGFLVKPADPEQLVRVMGHETAVLVRKSVDTRVQQMRRQIELAKSLLQTCAHQEPDRAASICNFLDRAVQGCVESLPGLPIAAPERRSLEQDLHAMTERIASMRESVRPAA